MTPTKWIRPSSIELNNFGPFVGKHVLKLPESGLILVRGLVHETGGGSGAGKSYLVNAPAFVTGGCPFAATELQSWYTEETPGIKLMLSTPDGDVVGERHDGLFLKGGLAGHKGLRTKSAESKLDEIFGMDKELRALATHRGQDQPALFLGMPDPKKKEVLTKLLRLDRFETVATAAAAAAKALEMNLASCRGTVGACQARVAEAEQALADCAPINVLDIDRLEADVAGRRVVVQGLLDEAKSKLAAAEAARKTCAAEVEVAVQKLKTETRAIRAEVRPAEIDELVATMEKIRSRLARVAAHDVEKGSEFENGRTELRLRLSQLGGERRSRILGLQAHLATKLATQRELSTMAAHVVTLRAQEKKLAQATCPTCEQSWLESVEELDRVRTEIDTIGQHLVKRPALDKEIENLKFNIANPAPDPEITELETTLAGYGDYHPHPMGAELRQAEKDTARAIDEAQQAWKQAQEAKLDVIGTREQRVRDTGVAIADAKAKDHQVAAAQLQARAAGEQVALDAVRFRIMEIKSAISTHSVLSRSLATAMEALTKAQETEEVTEAKINLELDVCAAVGKEGFLGLIFDDVLAEIAASTNDILKQVANVRHVTFEFQVEREAQNGNVAKLITPIVYSRGRKVPMAPGLSGGMGNAVKLAVDLGFGEVVAKRRGAYPGWLVLDESFNGLDRASKESCMEMLQVYAGDRLVLVVDHATEFQGLFSRIIEVEQVDGRSRIV